MTYEHEQLNYAKIEQILFQPGGDSISPLAVGIIHIDFEEGTCDLSGTRIEVNRDGSLTVIDDRL